MTAMQIGDVLGLLVLPWVLPGVVQRTRSLWSGRRGPPILQGLWDARRLLQKRAVYSGTSGVVFRVTPWLGLACALGAAVVVPILGGEPIVSFPFDFLWLVYAWGLGRAAIVLGALDTGSAFEGMGAAREATFAALVEPAFLLTLGALGLVTGQHTLAGVLAVQPSSGADAVAWLASAGALLVVVLIEGGRMPVDDPATHLELTMVHEVMVLDHSGPELAAIQLTAAVKLTTGVAMLAALLNPWTGGPEPAVSAAWNLFLCLVLAVCIGTGESVMARLPFRQVPRYLLAALVAAAVALLTTLWQGA